MAGRLGTSIRIGIDAAAAQAELRRLSALFGRTAGDISSSFAPVGRALGVVGGGIAALGTAMVGAGAAAVAYTTSIADATRETSLLADRLGIGIERFSALGRIAADFGGTAEDVADVIKDLSVRAVENEKEFTDLGVSIRGARGELLQGEALFLQVTQQLSQMGATQRAVAADILASDAFVRLADMAALGGDQIARLRDELVRTGEVITREQTVALDQWRRSMNSLGAAVDDVQRLLAVELAQALGPIIEQTTAWIRANRELVQEQLKRLGEALAQLIRDLPTIVSQLGGIAEAAGLAGIAISALTGNLFGLVASYGVGKAGSTIKDIAAEMRRLAENSQSAAAGLRDVAKARRENEAFGNSLMDDLQRLYDENNEVEFGLDEAPTIVARRRRAPGPSRPEPERGGTRYMGTILPPSGDSLSMQTVSPDQSEMFRGITDSATTAADAWRAAGREIVDQFGIVQSAGGALSDALTAAFSGEPIDAGKLLGGVVIGVGQSLVQLGTAAVAAGVLGTAVPALLPVTGGPAAIGAGLAAIAAGAGIIGVGSLMSGGGGGGGSVSRPSTSAGGGSRGGSSPRLSAGALGPEQSMAPTAVYVSISGPIDSRRAARELRDVLGGRGALA